MVDDYRKTRGDLTNPSSRDIENARGMGGAITSFSRTLAAGRIQKQLEAATAAVEAARNYQQVRRELDDELDYMLSDGLDKETFDKIPPQGHVSQSMFELRDSKIVLRDEFRTQFESLLAILSKFIFCLLQIGI